MFRSKFLLKAGRAGQIVLLVGLALLLITKPGHADDWPQFRGPSRNGVSAETGLLSTWPEDGPKEIWRHPFGEGYSAITAVDGRLYTAVADDSKRSEDGSPVGSEYAVAFDAQSREEVWRVEIGPKTFNEFGDGPRTTPTVDGDVVVMLGGTGTLCALSSETGESRWSVNL